MDEITDNRLVMKVLGQKKSLENLVVIWEYASNLPQNTRSQKKYEELHKMIDDKTKSSTLVYNEKLYEEKKVFVHWMTLNSLLELGYYGYLSVGNEILIRCEDQEDDN